MQNNLHTKSLEHLSIKEIINCLLVSFADYFVKMPDDLSYWEKRFIIGRVDFSLSFGMFSEDKLVGFIINGIDKIDDRLTAFNTGTGVIPEFRGLAIVDQLYNYAIPRLKEKGISHCRLEVITENEKAIRVYERIGFSKGRLLRCFKGELSPFASKVNLHEISFDVLIKKRRLLKTNYSWDNIDRAISLGLDICRCFEIASGEGIAGYFIINPDNGYIPQLEVYNSKKDDWDIVLNGISQMNTSIKINNVDDCRIDLIERLQKYGLENHLNQYEMDMAFLRI